MNASPIQYGADGQKLTKAVMSAVPCCGSSELLPSCRPELLKCYSKNIKRQHYHRYFQKKRKSLHQALFKIKSELMIFGFLSLSLSITKEPISKICIPKSAAETFLPCEDGELPSAIKEETSCHKQGMVSLLSEKGVTQLQILIFLLAFYHVISCILIFGLGMAKMRRWEAWEEETRTVEYQLSNDPRRFRLTKQTTFAQRHLKFWSDHRLLRWPVCLVRQFTGSVSKTDYMTLRHGFIMAHFAEGSEFNFKGFLGRALDKDLEVVVGVSVWIWMISVSFIFFNAYAYGFYTLVKPRLIYLCETQYKFGLRSCFHRKTGDIVIRTVVGTLVHCLCGYVTLPLYALVTQMGSSMKKVVFPEQVIEGLKNWHSTAKQNVATGNPRPG
ncbi:hypothetical protein IFM89_029252 [Coptis chinensis]|uniref:MLO-like protein n=1 Tax=Coptis chinensis TaxID=261450 RepID=A0A835GYP1_9MAGN|nr:hypothetical protein IFM89_029252 [Coptis chinensis]